MTQLTALPSAPAPLEQVFHSLGMGVGNRRAERMGSLGTPAYPQNDVPGLLTEWRRRRDGWEALCIWASEGGGWHSGWLDQRKLWPANSVPRDISVQPRP